MKAVLFDLDGTLLDTIPTICHHINGMLGARGLAPIDRERCASFIGNGAAALVRRALAYRGVTDKGEIDRALTSYNAAYDADPYVDTVIYNGMTELLRALALRGVILGVVTNKPEVTAKRLLSHFFPDVDFTLILGGGQSLPLKPDAALADHILSVLGLNGDLLIFVGDSEVDVRFARALGARAIALSWGYRSRDVLTEARADVLCDVPEQLAHALLP